MGVVSRGVSMESGTQARTAKRQRWWKTRSRTDSKPPAQKGDTAVKAKADGVVKTSKKGFRSGRSQTHVQKTSVALETSKDLSTKELEMDTDSSSEQVQRTQKQKTPKGGKRVRYILFIGSIPFSASKEDVIAHFRTRGVLMKDLRLLTRKETGESRGVAFAEFTDSKDMQNALKLHHTKLAGKRINVEVTCGGGGTSEKRQHKIQQRNTELRKKKRARIQVV